jgi:hypothetical protein
MIDDLSFSSEEDVVLATDDYFEPEGRKPILPGRYISKSRELSSGTTKSGKPSVPVKFDKFETTKGETVRDFPPYETLYFHMTTPYGGQGQISSVGAYLKACGLKYTGLTKDELKAELNQSANIPVVVIVGWEQDFKELETDPATGKPERPKKTSFFKGTDGVYRHQIQVDGRTYTARSRVVGYEKLK